MSAQPIPLPHTTPVFAPDGSISQIPDQYLPDAMSHGGKLAVQMKTPDGALHYVPHDQVRNAQLAGGQVSPMQGTPDAPKPAEGFWHSLGSVLGLTPEAMAAANQQAGQHPFQAVADAIDPMKVPKAMVQSAIANAPGLVKKAYGEAQASNDAIGHGDVQAFLAHQIGGMGYTGAAVASPALGNAPAVAGEQYGEGNIKGGLGTTAGILAPAIADAGIGAVSKIPLTKIVKSAAVVGEPIPVVGSAIDRLQRFKDAPQKLRDIWAKQAEKEAPPQNTAAGPVPSGEVPVQTPAAQTATTPQTVNAELPRTNSGEGVLTQALTALDNKTLLKVARSRGIDVTKEAQLKPGSADATVIKKIIDDFSPDELEEVRNQGIEISRHKAVPPEGVSPEAGKEAWHYKVLNTFFPDVSITKAMAARAEATIAARPSGAAVEAKARFDAARAAAESKANAVPVDDLQGGHAGNGVASVEELSRPGANYVVSKSGQLSYHGKSFAPEATPAGSSHVTVLPDGTFQVNAGPQLNASQQGALRFAVKKQPWLTKAAKAGD